jgi:hypothetical protein
MIERIAYSAGELRGVRYGAVPSDVELALEACIDGCDPAGGTAVKPGVVWRVGPWCIKRFEPMRAARRLVARSPAERSAELHFELPVRSPRPLAHLEREGGRRGSLLVAEFVEGSFLIRAWREDAKARSELPAMLAALNSGGWFHGDLHTRNLLWNGAEWVLIDLAAIRPRLHGLLRRRRVLDQWSRIACALRGHEGVREAFERYLEAMEGSARRGSSWNGESAWKRVMARADELADSWAPRRA